MKHPAVVRALLAGAFALAALSAPAQQIWKWRDASGQMHISDQPPPPGAAAGHKPVVGTAAAAAPEPAAEAASGAASGARPSVDPVLARRKAEADRKRAEQDAAQKDAQKKQEAAACAAAQDQLRTINSGIRLMRVNAQGEREYLDDAARAAQAQQAQSVVDRTCH